MPLAKTPGQLARCLKSLGDDTYNNYSIIGNLLTFRNVRIWQPNRITVFTNNVQNPKCIATVEDGRFSSEVCISAGDNPATRVVAREAIDYAMSLAAPRLQVAVHDIAHRSRVMAMGIPLRLRQRILIFQLRPHDFRPSGSGSVLLSAVTPAGSEIMGQILSQKASNGVLYRGAIEDGKLASWARAEPMAFSMCEICGVSTLPEHRRKGLAATVVSGLCRDVLDMGLTPVYLVKETNTASINLALSLGFTWAHSFCLYSARKCSVQQGTDQRGSAAGKANG